MRIRKFPHYLAATMVVEAADTGLSKRLRRKKPNTAKQQLAV